MKIEYSLVMDPADHHVIEDVTAYTYTEKECLIFKAEGLVLILKESEIEDFAVSL